MTILIIEDEEPTARKLQRLLADVMPTAHVVGMTVSVEESVDWLRTNPRPDLIFMDIELADGQSFDIFNRVAVASPVVFTTAYDDFAIKAFKVNSIDYLLKPVKEADLRQALDKLQQLKNVLADSAPTNVTALEASLSNLLQQLQQAAPATTTPAIPALRPLPHATFRDRFLIKQGQRLFSVSTEEVAYFFSRNKLSFLKTRDEHEWLVDYTMDELSQMLDPRRFFRLNRQVIAELRAVDKVHLYFNGKLKINLRPAFEEEVVVSREKAGELKGWLGE
ncbi:LytR/AlgR family response regulator transcription factor [Spirosoma validum]|uniref:Response regulator transcription factor n=1 Tax=Spirosoma validum TaxID=2771355 RepID=A0A927GET2_9BACT|nr:LytTR family DNA-binding domain-containing protein [Spirosoma validum]MBD2755124.1 response regulator transcription factor [Spirosoma validum]